jgi:hypothetical protein
VHQGSLGKGQKTQNQDFACELSLQSMKQIEEGFMSRRILNGWKEISKHIERGVRTAQRWEALLGMPVHRPALKDRSAVVAFTDELDHWISRSALDTPDANGEGRKESVARLHENMSSLARHTSELASQTKALQEKMKRSLAIHRNRSASRMRIRHASAPSRSMGAMLPFRPRNNPDHRLLIP